MAQKAPRFWARSFYNSVPSLEKAVIDVPSMGDAITDGTLIELHKQAGDFVQQDDVLCSVETDKVTVEVRTPVSGTIVEYFSEVDDEVLVGKPLFSIDTDGEYVPASASGGDGGAVAETMEATMEAGKAVSVGVGVGVGVVGVG